MSNYRKSPGSYRNTASSYTKPEEKPDSISVSFTCDKCNTIYTQDVKMYIVSNSRYDMTGLKINFKDCKGCNELINGLKSFRDKRAVMDNINVYPDYLVRISYNGYANSHSGYCSDPGEVNTDDITITHVYPLLKIFKTKHIRLDNTIDLNDKKLNYYLISTLSSCNCKNGETIYYMTSATVIRRSDMITLDD